MLKPYRIATDYRTHPTTGKAQIIARTHGPIRAKRLTVAYDHALSSGINHGLAAIALAQKIAGPDATIDQHSDNGIGTAYDWSVSA